MKGRLLKILSAVITVPILATSMIFATDVQAAGKTYSGTKTYDLGTRDKIKNEGVYFEPSADGKYPVMIYFHGASQYPSNDDLGNLPTRLLNDMNKWIEKGYCDPMVVITPRITKTADWGIGDFKKYFKREDNTKSDFDILLEQILSGSGIGEKIDTSKPIIVAGYSMGASAALYAGTLHPEIFYNVGAFSPSYCYYREDGWIQDASEVVFSQDPNGHFMLSYGIGEGTGYFDENVRRYIDTANNNGKNIKDRFKKRVYISDTGPHGWACVFETGTFEYLYYLKYDVLPDEETTVNAVFGIVTIEGTTTVGNTLTASLMSYYGVENYCGYQWYREDPSTGAFNAISGATSKTYTLTSADAGCKVRCKIWDTREPKTPQGSGKWGYSYRTTDVIASSQTPAPKAITGTVSLSSTSPCYGISVQATVKNSNATNLKYQWMRGDSAISGATSDWYAISKDDVGKQLSCVITDKDGKLTGSISSSKYTVGKACGPVAPTVTGVNCSSKGAKDGKITNVSDKMEYAVVTQNGPGAYTSCTGTTITGLAKGTYYVRIKETASTKCGAVATVKIEESTAKSITGTVSLSSTSPYYGISIHASVKNSNATGFKYQWMRGDSAISGATSEWYQISKNDIGKQLSCVVTDKDGKLVGSISSSKYTVGKACGPEAPKVTAVNCSSKNAKDGKITNVSDKMEYAVVTSSGVSAYTSCSGTTITGLAKGTYYVRYKETASVKAGKNAQIEIK